MPIFTNNRGRGPLFLMGPPSRSVTLTTASGPPPIVINTFLLQEDGFFLLQEDGFKVILDA